jgi:hypothetical protein
MAARKGLRPKSTVQAVLLRMSIPFVEQLDELCNVNRRSRREIVETLVAEAHGVYKDDPNDRINPTPL